MARVSLAPVARPRVRRPASTVRPASTTGVRLLVDCCLPCSTGVRPASTVYRRRKRNFSIVVGRLVICINVVVFAHLGLQCGLWLKKRYQVEVLHFMCGEIIPRQVLCPWRAHLLASTLPAVARATAACFVWCEWMIGRSLGLLRGASRGWCVRCSPHQAFGSRSRDSGYIFL